MIANGNSFFTECIECACFKEDSRLSVAKIVDGLLVEQKGQSSRVRLMHAKHDYVSEGRSRFPITRTPNGYYTTDSATEFVAGKFCETVKIENSGGCIRFTDTE